MQNPGVKQINSITVLFDKNLVIAAQSPPNTSSSKNHNILRNENTYTE